MTFDLVVLGAGPAWSSLPDAAGASYLVRTPATAILLDLGQGSFPRLASAIEPSRLDAVVISHLHPDHFIDLVPLRHYLTYELRPPRRMRVIAPDGLAGRLDALHAEPGFTAVALIRYEVTDQVVLLEGTCACGSSFRRIEDPQGRLDDIFEYADGLSVHPHVFRSALGRYPAILEYEVRQTRRGAAIRIVTTAPVDVRALEAKIDDALTVLGLADSRVTIEIVATIPRHASGKLKRFVPLSS